MSTQYQGQEVQVLREARGTDIGFMNGQDQVLIKTADGRERAVMRSDVEGLPGQDQDQDKEKGKNKEKGQDQDRSDRHQK